MIGKQAIAIFRDLDGDYTTEDKLDAIMTVSGWDNLKAVTKDNVVDALRFVIDELYDV